MRSFPLIVTFAGTLLMVACSGALGAPESDLLLDANTGDGGTGAPSAGAGGGATGASGGRAPQSTGGTGQGGAPDDFVVQEWGTFTSVQGPDGQSLGGLHHEDEQLPLWVHRRNLSDSLNYYFEQLPEEPHQQLETPVLYFWADRSLAVRVDVSFAQGVVGQWYPDATSFSPAIGALTDLTQGTMTWDVIVDPEIAPSSFLAVSPGEIWAPSRNVSSSPVRAKGAGGAEETEQFIFYRGVGGFDPHVHVVSEPSGVMHVRNDSQDALPAVFVLRGTETAGDVISLGPLAVGAERVLEPPAATLDRAQYEGLARSELYAALLDSGLYGDVAQAMVDTWTRSWFGNVGLRVLYLAPRKWADQWLPTKVTPAPSRFVRTLVGRIEVITPDEDAALVALLKASAFSEAPLEPSTLGRFAEPRLRLAMQGLSTPVEMSYATGVLDAAHALP